MIPPVRGRRGKAKMEVDNSEKSVQKVTGFNTGGKSTRGKEMGEDVATNMEEVSSYIEGENRVVIGQQKEVGKTGHREKDKGFKYAKVDRRGVKKGKKKATNSEDPVKIESPKPRMQNEKNMEIDKIANGGREVIRVENHGVVPQKSPNHSKGERHNRNRITGLMDNEEDNVYIWFVSKLNNREDVIEDLNWNYFSYHLLVLMEVEECYLIDVSFVYLPILNVDFIFVRDFVNAESILDTIGNTRVGRISKMMGGVCQVRVGVLSIQMVHSMLAWEKNRRKVIVETNSMAIVSYLARENAAVTFNFSTENSIQDSLRRKWKVRVHHVYRERNFMADWLAHLGSTLPLGFTIMDNILPLEFLVFFFKIYVV
ncbi:hypothetical protein GH714_025542 [Hevea brasiliensis]|uniref:RNase H type-1 domain-containing protein n=1 Tax=Hevea brasiliensis TaxID=3981 RepID=A0A6A6LE08_HEVBR|nr:hypothetical protein GH714_025542 [Hevea brasiliensis]